MYGVVLHEEVGCGHETNGGNGSAHDGLIDKAAIVCADISAQGSQKSHLEAKAPFHASCEDEGHCWNADRDRGSEHFQRIHLVDVVNAAEAEECHDEEAATGAEVADV